MRRYLSELVKTDELVTKIDAKGISDNSVFFKLPNDVWFITYESVTLEDESKCLNGKNIQVVPVT
jgi:L-rhamnose mutarotase